MTCNSKPCFNNSIPYFAVRTNPVERDLSCASVVNSTDYKEDEDDAFLTPPQTPKPHKPSAAAGKRKRDEESSEGSSDEDDDQDDSVRMSKSDKEKVDFFNQMIPKALKLAGYPSIHVKRGDLECTICKKTYTKTSMLRDHVNKTHMGKGKHGCTQCDKTYIEKKMLECHVAKEHQGEGVKCKHCDKTFITEKALKNHEPLHKPSQDVPCIHNGCIQTFRLQRYMEEHQQHCPFNPDRPEFPCPHCTRVFYQRKQLTRHDKKDHK